MLANGTWIKQLKLNVHGRCFLSLVLITYLMPLKKTRLTREPCLSLIDESEGNGLIGAARTQNDITCARWQIWDLGYFAFVYGQWEEAETRHPSLSVDLECNFHVVVPPEEDII